VELSFYGLKTRPFPLTKDPAFLWFGPPYQEALATLRSAVLDNAGFIVLTGDIGAGKSTVVDALIQSLEAQATVVGRITYPKPELPAFFRRLTDVFHLRAAETREAFLGEFRGFLAGAVARQHNVLLVIDEVRSLPRELAAAVADLLDVGERIGGDGENILNVLVVDDGDPGADAVILGPPVKVRCHLRALTEVEVGVYLRHQLKAAGVDRDLFTPDAARSIWAFSGGRPGLVNMSAYHTLLAAARQGAPLVEAHVVEDYATTLGAAIGPSSAPGRIERPPRRSLATAASGRARIVTAALTAGACLLALAVTVDTYVSPRLRTPGVRPSAATSGARGASAPIVPAQVTTVPAAVESISVTMPVPDVGAVAPGAAASPSSPVSNSVKEPARKSGRTETGPNRAPETAGAPAKEAMSRPRSPERSAAPRERAPAPQARVQDDAAEPDPGAIIDWLLKQGSASEGHADPDRER
jgi:type II secretory pathway predicted ATPase ExeA